MQAAQPHLGRAPRGGQRADADVDLAVAEREHPAVPGEQLARRSPRSSRCEEIHSSSLRPGADVAAGGHAVRGVAVPFAAEHPAERGACAVGDDQPAAAHRDPRRRPPRAKTTAVTRSPSRSTSTARAPVERHGRRPSARPRGSARRAPSAARRRRTSGSEPPGHGSVQLLRRTPSRAGPRLRAVRAHPVAEAEPLQLGDRARGEPVAAGLVAREDGGVGEDDVEPRRGPPRPRPPTPRARRPRRARRSRWAARSGARLPVSRRGPPSAL